MLYTFNNTTKVILSKENPKSAQFNLPDFFYIVSKARHFFISLLAGQMKKTVAKINIQVYMS
jgi:hypothetical protein